MTWTTDGSGQQVKRIRGRTIPQWSPSLLYPNYRGEVEGARRAWRDERRAKASRRAERREERIARHYRKWDRYSLSPTTPRHTARRWMREALEGAARKLGLKVRPGELSRDLRARIGAAQLRAVAATILRPTYERMTRDFMTRGFLQNMEPPIRDMFAEALGLKVTEAPNATVVHHSSEGGTVDGLKAEMDRMLGKTSISEPFEVPSSWDRATLRIGGDTFELSADGGLRRTMTVGPRWTFQLLPPLTTQEPNALRISATLSNGQTVEMVEGWTGPTEGRLRAETSDGRMLYSVEPVPAGYQLGTWRFDVKDAS